MLPYYHKIDIEQFDLDKVLNHPDVQAMTQEGWPYPWYMQPFNLKECLPEFWEWVEDRFKSPIVNSRFFTTLPHQNTTVHIDQGYMASLNVPIINCENSYNAWYHLKPGVEMPEPLWKQDTKNLNYSATPAAAYMFKPEDLDSPREPGFGKQYAQVKMTGPVVFNTSIPHNVLTGDLAVKDKPRLLLAVRTDSMRRINDNCFERVLEDLGFA